HVRMMRHRTAPRVQHRGEADLHTEALGVRGDRQQRLGARLEQEVVDDGLVVVGDGADLRRQGEHDVEVGHLQQLGLARLQPLPRLTALALRTVPVAAGVVGDDGVPARLVLAARDVATESRRAAALDRAHRLELTEAHMAAVGTTPSGPVIAEDVRDLHSWTGHGAVYVGASLPGTSEVSRSSGLAISRSTLLATCA